MGIVQPVPTRGPGGARRKQAGREQGGDFSSGSKVPVLTWDVHPRRCETSAEAIPSFKEKYISYVDALGSSAVEHSGEGRDAASRPSAAEVVSAWLLQ